MTLPFSLSKLKAIPFPFSFEEGARRADEVGEGQGCGAIGD